MLDKILYDFLAENIKGWQIRRPFQSAELDLTSGYISWYSVAKQAISTQTKHSKKNDAGSYSLAYAQRFKHEVMIIAERFTARGIDSVDIMGVINILLNSKEFINKAKNAKIGLEALRIAGTMTTDHYLHDSQNWIARAMMPVEFLLWDSVELRDAPIHNLGVEIENF